MTNWTQLLMDEDSRVELIADGRADQMEDELRARLDDVIGNLTCNERVNYLLMFLEEKGLDREYNNWLETIVMEDFW